MTMLPLGREATLDDLWEVEGKAELVDGEIELMSPSGGPHGVAALSVATSLKLHQRAHGGGYALGDGVGFVSTARRTFSPGAAWYTGEISADVRVLSGVPALAVEVRSPDDYGPAAERRLAAKREAYFAAGTQVVWDVDVLREGWIRVHRTADPGDVTVYRRGEVAEAEPAVPGWRFPVDELFD
jgi:Uma2 family endonuclease